MAIDEEGFVLDSEYKKIDEELQLNNVFDRGYDEYEESLSCLTSIEEFYKRLKNVEKVLNFIGCHDVKVFQSDNNFNIVFSRIETNEEFAIRIAQTVREIKYNIKREKARERRAQKKKDQGSKSIDAKRKECQLSLD